MMMRPLFSMLLGLSLLAAPASAWAAGRGEVVEVRPGAVATLVVSLAPRSAAEAPARFTIEPAAGVRILGATSGVLRWEGKGERRLPVTLTVAADAPAGEIRAGRLVVEWADGQRSSEELRVRVGTVRRLALAVAADEPVVRPGGSARVRYRVTNRGNGVDTVHLEAQVGAPWSSTPGSASYAIPAGQMVEGSFEVKAPRTAPVGEERRVLVRALGRGAEEKAVVALLVVESTANALGLAQIPASVYLGGVPGSEGVNLAIQGQGSIGPRTRVGLELRHLGSSGASFGAPELWGPRALLTLSHDGLAAELGQIHLAGTGIARGTAASGAGARLGVQRGALSGGIVAARPLAWGGTLEQGRLLQGELGYALPLGTLSARVFDFDWGGAVGRSHGFLRGAGLGFLHDGGGRHRASVELGLVQSGADTGEATGGASVDASYGYHTPDASLTARVRTAPAQHRGSTLAGDEASLTGSLRVLPAVHTSGSLFWHSRPLADGTHAGEGHGANLGVQVSGLGSTLGLGWSLRESGGLLLLGGSERRTALSASLSTGVGPLSLRLQGESGTVVRGDQDALAVHRVQGQLRWSRPGKSAWLGASYADERLFASPVRLETGTELRLGAVSLNAVAGAQLGEDGMRAGHLRVGTETHLHSTLSLIAGAEYQPWRENESRWTVSLGVRKSLPLPLPMRPLPVLSGSVFDDRNGNGRQDDGEPGLPGVAVSVGEQREVTDARGRFAFKTVRTVGNPVRLDVTTLGEGMLAATSELAFSADRAHFPIVRAAALEVTLFEDRDGDRVQGQGEPHVADVTLLLESAQGRAFPHRTDAAGRAVFSALPPGAYRATIHRAGQDPLSVEVQVAPGEAQTLVVPVASQARKIRMWSGAPADSTGS